jgi:hypothetical protein
VAWDKVASLKRCGGLVIPNLHLLNLALRCRWAWLQRADPSKAWAEFDLKVPPISRALFESATAVTVGNEERALFWKDRWLHRARVSDVAPNLVSLVNKRHANSR